MKNLFLFLFVSTMALAAWGVRSYFQKYHRANNSEAPRPELIIYTHSSFMNPYGPGPDIAKQFEKICLCKVRYVDGGGGQVLLHKLKLNSSVDVVMGMDQLFLKEAAVTIKWRDLHPPDILFEKSFEALVYKYFVPYDWSPLSFVFKGDGKTKAYPTLTDFLRSSADKSLNLQDPRESNLGLQMLYWLFHESQGDPKEFSALIESAQKKVNEAFVDWSSAYGAFKRGFGSGVFSFSLSPVYHLRNEQDENFYSVKVANGHPQYIEYVAVPDACRSCGLAKRFVEYLLSPESQKILWQKNIMLPVVQGVLSDSEKGDYAAEKPLSTKYMDNFVDEKNRWLDLWDKGLGHE